MSGTVNVTFGMIVLNGEPFLRYNLRALYPFAHQIIVVEGGAPGAAIVAGGDGHSTDGTLETLESFGAQEDPDGKLIVVTAEDEGHPSGFWPGEKHEQSQAYAKRTTGDYLWQVDVDEFYRAQDTQFVLQMLGSDPEITAVSFNQVTFWGGFDYVADGYYLWRKGQNVHRLFRWRPGYAYVSHRPPSVHDEVGQDLRAGKWIRGEYLAERGIVMYHYSLVFPRQVMEKCAYYRRAPWAHTSRAEKWARRSFLGLRRPYRVHNVYHYPSWLQRSDLPHPEQIEALRADLGSGAIDAEMRHVEDVERLLGSRLYLVGRQILIWLEPIDRVFWEPVRRWIARLEPLVTDPVEGVRRVKERIAASFRKLG